MNYDEYIKELEKYDSDETVKRLIHHLKDWKSSEDDVLKLEGMVEHFFGNSWIESTEIHNKLYQLWASFKKEAIDPIGGHTMNERLYWFGLFEQFDRCKNETEKQIIYAKLQAST